MSNISCRRKVLVTGVGFHSVSSSGHDEEVFTSKCIKPNMGAAIALELAQVGFPVILAARTEDKLCRVRDAIKRLVDGAEVQIRVVDLLDSNQVRALAESMPKDLELDLVQSTGLSAGGYRLEDNNPYLPVENMPTELPTREFDAVVRSLLIVVQAFLERWRTQSETRIVVVNSMSGIRAYPRGFSHASAKAGLHHAVRSLSLELAKQMIFVSEVNPGAVATGYYDSPSVQQAVAEIGRSFGYEYQSRVNPEHAVIPQMPPRAVAEAVVLCLTSDAHILSVNAVAKGQFPNHGA